MLLSSQLALSAAFENSWGFGLSEYFYQISIYIYICELILTASQILLYPIRPIRNLRVPVSLSVLIGSELVWWWAECRVCRLWTLIRWWWDSWARDIVCPLLRTRTQNNNTAQRREARLPTLVKCDWIFLPLSRANVSTGPRQAWESHVENPPPRCRSPTPNTWHCVLIPFKH